MMREALIRELEGVAPPDLADPEDAGRIGLVIEGREVAYMLADQGSSSWEGSSACGKSPASPRTDNTRRRSSLLVGTSLP
jgi:hypothetical protein